MSSFNNSTPYYFPGFNNGSAQTIDNNTGSGVTEILSNSTTEYWPAGLPSGYTWLHIILISVLVSFIMIVIILGNLMVCMAIIRDRNLQSIQNWFIFSLAVSDMLVGLLIMPFSLSNELMGYWIFGTVLCDLWLATDVLLCTASILNLCIISLDRYWSITKAIQYAHQRTSKRAAVMIAIVWLLSAIICLPPLIGWKIQRTESDFPKCLLSEELGYVLYSTMGSFYIPMTIMIFVYCRIYIAARERARRSVKKAKYVNHDYAKDKSSSSTTSFVAPAKDKNVQKVFVNANDTEGTELDDVKSKGNCVNETIKQTFINKNCELKHVRMNIDTDSVDTTGRSNVTSDSDCCDTPPMHGKHMPLYPETDSSMESADKKKRFEYGKALGADTETEKPLLQESDSTCTELASPKVVRIDEKYDAIALTEVIQTGETGKNNNLITNTNCSASNNKPVGIIVNKTKHHHHHHTKTHRKERKWRSSSLKDADKLKRKLAKARERRATLVLGLVTGTFIFCWFPFFTSYVVDAFCKCVPGLVFNVFFWAGYVNSALNPVIYTIFNKDFRQAFQKIVCGRTKRP